jgi:hypothetical protein
LGKVCVSGMARGKPQVNRSIVIHRISAIQRVKPVSTHFECKVSTRIRAFYVCVSTGLFMYVNEPSDVRKRTIYRPTAFNFGSQRRMFKVKLAGLIAQTECKG